MFLRPVQERTGEVKRGSGSQSDLFQLLCCGCDLIGNGGIEAKYERRLISDGGGGPDFRGCSYFQHASEAEALVADALVWVLRALTKLAEAGEIVGAKRDARVADQQYRSRDGFQYEGYLPEVVGCGLLQRVVCILQQFQNAAPPVRLSNLSIETGDRTIVLRAVLEFVEERLHLTLRLSRDESVAGLPGD
ncbi:MAG: hypothetical protein OXQ29_10275 [Rhodospirillaceae bacterium]|nr:hypothetical protein [Rhodospirillaceae bacterium]